MSFFSFLSSQKKESKQTSGETLTARTNNTFRDVGDVQREVMDVAIHQLKTPLVGIKWSLKMVLDGNAGPLSSEQRALLERCFDENEKIIQTIDGLLYADKIESKKYRYTFLDAYIPDLIAAKIAELVPNAESKKITIKTDVADNLPNISIDTEKILVVLQNLIENSIRYTGTGGVIKVSARNGGDFITLSVEDNGAGIPQIEQDRIFNKFFRAQNAVKIDPNGSGLGLYIAKEIIEKHGGKIWFESREGRGTKVCFTLPLKK